jgi:hypothetical protein
MPTVLRACPRAIAAGDRRSQATKAAQNRLLPLIAVIFQE